MKSLYALIIIFQTSLLFAQQDITRLTEMQKIFFVSEASGLASASYNPAAMSIRPNNNGVVIGYDFDDVKAQGNSSVFLTTENIGISYQDVYNINNIRLKNYAINLSIGNKLFSIGTTNRYTMASYSSYELKRFSFDAGIILRPASFLSLGLLARNLGEGNFDSLNYIRNYTAGIGLTFFDETFNLYADADFRDNSKLNDISGTIGLVIVPINLFEFRGGVVLNPDNIQEIRDGNSKIIDLKYEGFVSVGFLIKNTIRVTAAARFNDVVDRTRFTAVFGFPLSNTSY
jgi:murein DD-endopeptidase MepM/ murein hydrolase activator NlpD